MPTKYPKNCYRCGAVFHCTKFRLRVGSPQEAKYCSRACLHASLKADEGDFWAKVNKTPGCWLWTGARHIRGYGACGPSYGDTRAHRASWKFTNGPIPKGLGVLHKCNTELCVRPDHLYLGDQKQNHADMRAAGHVNHAFTPITELRHPQLSAKWWPFTWDNRNLTKEVRERRRAA